MLNSHPNPMNCEPLFKRSWEPFMKGYITFWQAHLARIYAGYGSLESTDEGDVITGITVSDVQMAEAAITTLDIVQIVKQELIDLNILTVTDAVSLNGTPVYYIAIKDLCAHIMFKYYYNPKERRFMEIQCDLNRRKMFYVNKKVGYRFLPENYKSSRDARAVAIIRNDNPIESTERRAVLQLVK